MGVGVGVGVPPVFIHHFPIHQQSPLPRYPGYRCPPGSTTGNPTNYECPPGTFCYAGQPESIPPFTCPEGTYSPGQRGECTTCSSTSIAPNPRSSICESCDFGHISSPDRISCSPCHTVGKDIPKWNFRNRDKSICPRAFACFFVGTKDKQNSQL